MSFSNFNILKGNNLTGKSDFLKEIIDDSYVGVYINPLANNAISGLASTVKSEIEFHKSNVYKGIIDYLIDKFSFMKLYGKNPFELSGGQQVLLNLITSIYIAPEVLSIDSSLEQLSCKLRKEIIDLFLTNELFQTRIYLTDNRFIELDSLLIKSKVNIIKNKVSNPFRKKFFDIKSSGFTLRKKDTQKLLVKNLKFAYDKNSNVLKGINCEFLTGNLYLLDGENGEGKSTFAKLLSGVLKPNSGQFYLNDKKISTYKNPGKFVGYSFQNPTEQIFNDKVINEIIPFKNIEFKDKLSYAKIFGLSNHLYENSFSLPLVIQKRLTLASTLSMERSFVIFDEPTLFQDDHNAIEIAEILKLLVYSNYCVILISHSTWFRSLLNFTKLTLKNGQIFNYES